MKSGITMEKTIPPVGEKDAASNRAQTEDFAPNPHSEVADISSPKQTIAASKGGAKRALLTVVLAVAVVAGAIASYAGWQYMSSHESTDDAYVDGNITQISSRIGGNVSRVLVEDNQYVKAGQVLVELDPRDLDIKIAQAKAALEKNERQAQADSADVVASDSTAGAQSETASSEISHANASIASAKSIVSNAHAAINMELAKLSSFKTQALQYEKDLKRYEILSAQGAISKQQYDQAKTNYEVAMAQIVAEEQAIQQARSNAAKADADLQRAYSDLSKTRATVKTAEAAHQQINVKSHLSQVSKATVNQAKADLQNALLQRSYCQIVAPVDGRVGKKSVHPGEQIQPGQALFTIVPDQSWLTANYKETQIGKMRPGQAVDITLDAFPGQHFTGKVDSIAPASGAKFALMPAENATGNFTKIVQRIPVKIVFDERGIASLKKFIAPGLSAQVTVALSN